MAGTMMVALGIPLSEGMGSAPALEQPRQPNHAYAQRIAAAMAWQRCLSEKNPKLYHSMPHNFTFHPEVGGWAIMRGSMLAYGPCLPLEGPPTR